MRLIAAGTFIGAFTSVGLAADATVMEVAVQPTLQKEFTASGVDDYRVCEPMFEAVRVILTSRGETYSPAYVQGISGAAFRIAGICPCAPTCSTAMEPRQLAGIFGYEVQTIEVEGVSYEKMQAAAKLLQKDRLPDMATVADPDARKVFTSVQQIIDRARFEVLKGRPVIVWHAFTNAEMDVVTGFDAETREFTGISSYKGTVAKPARAGDARTLTTVFVGGGPSAMVIGSKTGRFDARAAEIAAIREAVRHGRDQKNVDKLASDKWVMLEGIAAYQRWAADFKKPDKKREAGDAYCWGIYSHTHPTAGPFLREIAGKYPKAANHLQVAATYFEDESKMLGTGGSLLHWGSPEGPDLARNIAAAGLLDGCAKLYANGISELEKALPLMEQ